MAHSLSAKKRVRQNAKKRIVNRARKSRVKTMTKQFESAITAGNVAQASEELKVVSRKLDKTAATSSMHKRTAARKKSRLAKKLNKLKAKTATV